MMTIQLTEEDRLVIRERITFLSKLSKNLTSRIIITISIGLFISVLFDIITLLVGLFIATITAIYIMYQINWKYQIQLKKDLIYGSKKSEKLKISGIKKRKDSTTAIMNNGLSIDLVEFEEYNFTKNELTFDTEFYVEFTLYNNLILRISNSNM